MPALNRLLAEGRLKMNKKMKFEDAMTSLENIVKKLESSTLALDESLSAFEEAVGLIRLCNEKLEAAEQKVMVLTEADDGTVSDVPFDVTDET